MRRYTGTVLLALLCLSFTSCSCDWVTPESSTEQPTLKADTATLLPLPTAFDRGLLYGEPCSPPCWEGITPGISSEDEVVRVFEQLKSEGKIESYTLWDFRAEGRFGATYVTFGNGYVAEIRIHSEFDYRVSQLIGHFGEPEVYAPYSSFSRDNCSCENWDDKIYSTASSSPGYFLYPAQGVTFLVAIADGYTGCICPEMKTRVFYYYEPRSLTDALKEDRSPACARRNFNDEDLVQWHGYGPGY